jgi:hypothetical protein
MGHTIGRLRCIPLLVLPRLPSSLRLARHWRWLRAVAEEEEPDPAPLRLLAEPAEHRGPRMRATVFPTARDPLQRRHQVNPSGHLPTTARLPRVRLREFPDPEVRFAPTRLPPRRLHPRRRRPEPRAWAVVKAGINPSRSAAWIWAARQGSSRIRRFHPAVEFNPARSSPGDAGRSSTPRVIY